MSGRAPRRVLFVLKWRERPYEDTGVSWGDGHGRDQPLSSGLYNSARFVAEMLADAGVPTSLVHVHDGNDIHRQIVAFGATDVIIEAFWCPPYKFDDLRRACPNVRFIVRNHSETPFLSAEGVAFDWTMDYLERPHVDVAPNAVRMLADTRFLARQAHPDWSDAELARRVPFLPNFYPTDLPRHPRKSPNSYIDVGCFGAVRPLKNLVTQAIGAMIFARELGRHLHFNINGQRIEGGGGPALKNLQAIFENNPHADLWTHAWLPHADFRGLVAQMDLVTQVTFSETFSIVSADAVSQGVPTVTSAEVPWTDAASHADPTDARSIAAAMRRAWDRRWATRFVDPNLAGLRHFNARSRRLWLAHFHA